MQTRGATVSQVTAPEIADAAPGPAVARSLLQRWALTSWDAGALTLACLLIVAFAPPLFLAGWTPRMAMLIGVMPVGLALLTRLCLVGDLAARLLGAALCWTVLSAVLSPAPHSALIGFAGRDLSALTVIGAGGFWALGRMMSESGRTVLPELVVWATAACALVGVLQVIADVQRGSLALAFGRPTGFVTNPVYFGALCSAGLVAAVASWSSPTWRRLAAPLVVLGAATSLSGSRVALMAALLTLLALSTVTRTRTTLVASGVAVASLAGGILLDRWVGAGRNAASRLVEGSGAGSGDGRFTVWRYGLEAWTERPILGHGFGRFRPAVQGKFTPDFIRRHAADEVVQPWFDAHNVGIGVLVAVGVVGLALFGAWAVVWARRVSGAPAWILVPVLLHWLLQPVSLFTLPFAMLVLGCAGRPNERAPSNAELSRRVAGAAAVVGLVAGGSLLAVDLAFERAASAADAEQLDSIADALWDDPIIADVVAQAYALGDGTANTESKVIEWRRRAAVAEPDRPYWWSRLADALRRADRPAEAEQALDRAFALQPFNQRSQLVEILLALEEEDEPRLAEALDLACELGQSDCDLDAATLIAQKREQASG